MTAVIVEHIKMGAGWHLQPPSIKKHTLSHRTPPLQIALSFSLKHTHKGGFIVVKQGNEHLRARQSWVLWGGPSLANVYMLMSWLYMSNTVYVVSVQWTGLPGKKKAKKRKLLHRKNKWWRRDRRMQRRQSPATGSFGCRPICLSFSSFSFWPHYTL